MNTHTCTQISYLYTLTVHEICLGGGLRDRDAKGKQRSLQEEEGGEAVETHRTTQEQ